MFLMGIELNASYAGDVQIYGGIHDEGEVIRSARVFVFGDTARLMIRDVEEPRYMVADTLTSIEGHLGNGDNVVISGVSDQLRTEVGLEASNSVVRWEIHERGCPTCR